MPVSTQLWSRFQAGGARCAGLERRPAGGRVDAKVQEPVAALQALGGARLILATAANCKSMSPLLGALAPRGQPRNLRTDDAKRSSLQNRAGHGAITRTQFRSSGWNPDET